ncbi:hypothetical protein ONZ45_g2598 [Pleurotus djamor]|nr:hypothetical protein ONZ45_g2598 [Pleurotus djamor]
MRLQTVFVTLAVFALEVLGAPAGTVHELQRRAVVPQFAHTEVGLNRNDMRRASADAAVTALLGPVQGLLKIPENVQVTITNDFHVSGSDTEPHVTFNFNFDDSVCKTGKNCVGHAYMAGSPKGLGKIFDGGGKKTGKTLYPA